MVGDFECVNNLNYESSVCCTEQEGKVIEIDKEDFFNIESEKEQWEMVKQSVQDV